MRILLCSLLLASAFTRPSRGATIDITYNFAPAEAQGAIEHATSIWESILVSEVPIKVLVTWAPLGNATLGITFPNGRKDFPSAPVPLTWYPTALANAISGTEQNPGENDFEFFLNSSSDWYFGTDGETPEGQYDLVSVALHEMGHGLGFVGLSKKEGSTGSLGLLLQSDFAPLTTSFPWPQLDTLPGIFDRFLAHPQNGPLDLMMNPGTALGSAMTSNQLRFNGPFAIEANDGTGPRIYSPSAFALGSSCVHLNESSYPDGNPNELMTPFSPAGSSNHWPGPICLAIMRDIGWNLAPDVGVPLHLSSSTLDVFPNPTTGLLSVSVPFRSPATVTITDALGRKVMRMGFTASIDVQGLAPGCYMLLVDGTSLVARFSKN